MVDGGRRPRLADEPLPERLVAGDLWRQDLERHPPVQPDVVGAVDDRHAAPADVLGQPVTCYLRASREITSYRRDFVRHGASRLRRSVQFPLSLFTRASSWHQYHSSYMQIAYSIQ